MEKLKSKKAVISILITSIVIVVFTLVTVAFMAGRDLSNEDTSASTESTQDGGGDAALNSNSACEMVSPGISYCLPKYHIVGERVSVYVGYYENFNQPVDWEVQICNKNYKFNSISRTLNFKFPNKNCNIAIKYAPGTSEEKVVASRQFTPIRTTRSYNMGNITIPNRTGVDYTAVELSGDIQAGLSAKAVTSDMVKDVLVSYRANGDICEAFIYSEGTKIQGSVYPLEVGRCKLTVTTKVVTCKNCNTEPYVVYTSTKSVNMQIVKEGVLPSPTSYWVVPSVFDSITPTPTISDPSTTVTPTPTNVPRLTVTPTPMPTGIPLSGLIIEPNQVYLSGLKEQQINVSVGEDSTEGYQLRIKIEGDGRFVPNSFVNSNRTIGLGVCDNLGTRNTENEICVDIASTGEDFKYRDSLGSFKILAASSGSVTLKTNTGNGYLQNGQIVLLENKDLITYRVR